MAISMTLLRALALAALFATATGDQTLLPALPLNIQLPTNCGAFVQVRQGDTCQSIADYGGISLSKFTLLNPLALCGLLPLFPGSVVCAGDTLSFCSNRYVATAGDTCDSIQNLVGTVLALAGGKTCSTLTADTQLCVNPTAANPCAVDTLCGASISPALQTFLQSAPDYCTILKKCEAPVTTGTLNGAPSLTVTLSDVTPTIQSVLGNDGHPELKDFAAARAAGPATLAVTFVPGGASDGSNLLTFAGSVGSSGRKLLGYSGTYYPPNGGTKYPCGSCNYGRKR